MSWWYVSSPSMTCAVEVEDGIIVGGAPIVRKFIGQPAKNLGDWLRSQGEVEFKRIETDRGEAGAPAATSESAQVAVSPPERRYTFAWGNNEKRATLKGRECRILLKGAMRSVMVEFENGQREIVSHRALRERRTNEGDSNLHATGVGT